MFVLNAIMQAGFSLITCKYYQLFSPGDDFIGGATLPLRKVDSIIMCDYT